MKTKTQIKAGRITFNHNETLVHDQAKTIKTVFDRMEKSVSLRPEVGQGTATLKARIDNGLTCQIKEGSWKMMADLDRDSGGNGTGPSPSTRRPKSFSSYYVYFRSEGIARSPSQARQARI